MSRCLYNSSFKQFMAVDENSIFGALCDNITATRLRQQEKHGSLKYLS